MSSSIIVPEVGEERLSKVSGWISQALGDDDDTHMKNKDRYESARLAAKELQDSKESYELVYGELSVPVLATILDAVGVHQGDRFLDIGSGDGALVFAASLLYGGSEDGSDNAIEKARGLEIVPGLYQRSLKHLDALQEITQNEHGSPIEFVLGDVHDAHTDESLKALLQDTTLAVCFATTWSAGNAKQQQDQKTSLQGRKLHALSKALSLLPTGARTVIVDGRLNKEDGHDWQGDLRIECPDTAPFSIASLYVKI